MAQKGKGKRGKNIGPRAGHRAKRLFLKTFQRGGGGKAFHGGEKKGGENWTACVEETRERCPKKRERARGEKKGYHQRKEKGVEGCLESFRRDMGKKNLWKGGGMAARPGLKQAKMNRENFGHRGTATRGEGSKNPAHQFFRRNNSSNQVGEL